MTIHKTKNKKQENTACPPNGPQGARSMIKGTSIQCGFVNMRIETIQLEGLLDTIYNVVGRASFPLCPCMLGFDSFSRNESCNYDIQVDFWFADSM